MQELMLWLQGNFWLGLGVVTGVVVFIHLLVSLLIFFKMKRVSQRPYFLGFIPLVNLGVLLGTARGKKNRPLQPNEAVSL